MASREFVVLRKFIPASSNRFVGVDALRGLIIVVMALDHANHFIAQKHPQGELWGGPFPHYSSALPFLTRFVTHIAAPGFFLLMGIGMTLFALSRRKKGWSRWRVSRFFLIRGLLLITIQFVLVNRAWELSPGGWGLNTYVGVLFALGGTMILASGLVWLRSSHLIGLSIILFIVTELLHPDPELWGSINWQPVNLLLVYPGGDFTLWSNYPILPWLELVVFGLAFGYWMADDPHRATKLGLRLGVVFLVSFLLLRYLDGFGNIRPRSHGSWIDFLNVVKYPPSLTFTLLTTGINLIFLRVFTVLGIKRAYLLQPLAIYGQAPLLFYVLHLFVYAGLGYLFFPGGTSIPAMLPLWIIGLLILFPVCVWYVQFRNGKREESLWRYV